MFRIGAVRYQRHASSSISGDNDSSFGPIGAIRMRKDCATDLLRIGEGECQMTATHTLSSKGATNSPIARRSSSNPSHGTYGWPMSSSILAFPDAGHRWTSYASSGLPGVTSTANRLMGVPVSLTLIGSRLCMATVSILGARMPSARNTCQITNPNEGTDSTFTTVCRKSLMHIRTPSMT